jgi:hypothetical protein
MTIDLTVLSAGAFLVLMVVIWKVYRGIDERLTEIQADIGELKNGVSHLFCWLRNPKPSLFPRMPARLPARPMTSHCHSRLVWKATWLWSTGCAQN